MDMHANHPLLVRKNRTIFDIQPGDKDIYRWACPAGHCFEESVAYMTRDGKAKDNTEVRPCPVCNSLGMTYPNLMCEWDFKKNKDLNPYYRDVVAGTNRKVWWNCSSCGRSYQASPNSRTGRGSGCSACNRPKSISKLQYRVYSEMSEIFEDVRICERVGGQEIDIYLKDFEFGIEIDSHYYHKSKVRTESDRRKNAKVSCFLLRLREKPLKNLSDYDLHYSETESAFVIIVRLLEAFIEHNANTICERQRKQILSYMRRGEYIAESRYFELINPAAGMVPPGKSLKEVSPALVKQWHPRKNASLDPSRIYANSNVQVWWQCPEPECREEWNEAINARRANEQCPYCRNARPSKRYNFATEFPVIARDWDISRNDGLRPENYLPFAYKAVYWTCHKCGWEFPYKVEIRMRTRSSGGRVTCKQCNSLKTHDPELAAIYDDERNPVPVNELTKGHHDKLFWRGQNKKMTIQHMRLLREKRCRWTKIIAVASMGEPTDH